MLIRKLSGSDELGGAIGLLCRFFAEEDFATAPEVIASHTLTLAGLDTCGLFIAEENGNSIGVATVSLEFGIEYGWWAELGDLYVVPEWRGHGLSRKLVEAAEGFLRQRGASGYQVTVTPYASEAHDLARYSASPAKAASSCASCCKAPQLSLSAQRDGWDLSGARASSCWIEADPPKGLIPGPSPMLCRGKADKGHAPSPVRSMGEGGRRRRG